MVSPLISVVYIAAVVTVATKSNGDNCFADRIWDDTLHAMYNCMPGILQSGVTIAADQRQ